MKREASGWLQDAVFFDSSVRRSGNSLVVTIPPELARRFLVSENMKVRLVGMTRSEYAVEGAISVYLGRFIVEERCRGLRFQLRGEGESVDFSKGLEGVPFLTRIAQKHSAVRFTLDPKTRNHAEFSVLLSGIQPEGIKPRASRELEELKARIIEEAGRAGIKVERVEGIEESVEWEAVDPSLISRSLQSLPQAVKYRWEL